MEFEIPESLPYGNIGGSINTLKKEIRKRSLYGQPLLGEGTLHLGARVIKTPTAEYLETQGETSIPLEFRVDIKGNFALLRNLDENFTGNIPPAWTEQDNP